MATKKRLIDGNARIEEIRKAYCTNCDNYDGVRCRSCWVDDAVGLFEDAPTVDAVEVVRCKDCVNYCGFERCKNGICDVDSVSKRAVYPNDFCSFGERRTDNGC